MNKSDRIGSLIRQEKAKHPPVERSSEDRITELERQVEWLSNQVTELYKRTTP